MRYRTGRHNHRIVYRQYGDDPSDSDDMVAVFFDAVDALAVVDAFNAGSPESPATVNPELAVDRAEVVHANPHDGSGTTPCCGRTPFELPPGDRMTMVPFMVTCDWSAPPPDMRSRRQGGRGAVALGPLSAGEPLPPMPEESYAPDATPLATGGIIINPGPALVDEDGCALAVPQAADETVSVPPPGRCVFCERIEGGYVKWLDHDVASFEPLNPVTPGHLLVVPRRHVADATESPEVSGLVMSGAARVAATLGDCNIITSVGEAATQTIRHLHLHVVPRHHGDGLTLPWTGQHTEMPHA